MELYATHQTSSGTNSLQKPRILLVDDEDWNTQMLKASLDSTEKYEVKEENNPLHVFQAVKEFKPDLVFLDVNMPHMDGGDIASEIMAKPEFRNVQIVFLTAMISKTEAGETGSVRGGMRFLAKPVGPKEMLSFVDRYFASKKS